MAVDNCGAPTDTRRRTFWTTQVAACGEYVACGDECGIPGLQFDQDVDVSVGRTFLTNDWVRSLLLNILNTNGRQPATACGVPPGTQGGHWSESYREDGLKTGSLLRDALQRPVARVQEGVNLVRAQVQADVYKLVQLGVASRVDVTAEYAGSNKIDVTIVVYGPSSLTTNVVNLTADRLTNAWVWK